MTQVEASGTLEPTPLLIAIPAGRLSPDISAAFTVSPEVVYSPIVPVLRLVTNKFPPDTAMPVGVFNPEISAAFTVAPVVAYSPIVPMAWRHDKQIASRTAMPLGRFNPDISAAFTVAPEMVNLPIVPMLSFATNRFPPDTRDACLRRLKSRHQRGVHRRPRKQCIRRSCRRRYS